MQGKVFKRTLFGVSQTSVNTYFSKINEKFANELENQKAQIDDLRAQLRKRSSSPMPIQTQDADEILEKARKQAEFIVNNAHHSLQAKKAELQKQIKEERIKLKILQAEVRGLQKQAADAATRFTIELNPLLEEDVS